MTALTDLSLTDAQRLLKNGDISAVELVKAYLKAIEDAAILNCYVTICQDKAIEQAKQSDLRLSQGNARPLEGIPIGVKDVFCTKNVETTACSKILKGFIPPYESTVTQKLWDAGAIMLGKLNHDEFAMGSSTEYSCFGPVISPVRKNGETTAHVAGGSSGGSSASVAARLCLAATATDTGGSIRQPASLTGTVGIKPTYGLCSRYGIVAFASSLDQAGIITHTVEDSAAMLTQMVGYDHKDSTSLATTTPEYHTHLSKDVSQLRVGIPKEYTSSDMLPAIQRMWEETADMLAHQGAKIVEVSLPHTHYALPTYYVVALAEASSNLARYDGIRYGNNISNSTQLIQRYRENRAQFGEEVKRRIFLGTFVLSAKYYDAYYIKAQKVRRLIRDDFNTAFEKVDVLLTPTTSGAAFALGEKLDDPVAMYLNDLFTVPVNMAGLPAISFPMGKDSAGLPLGMQLIGKPLGEQTILNTAYFLEDARGKIPKLHPWWLNNTSKGM